MNKQQQVNADELMAQVGRVVEAIQELPQEPGNGGQAASGHDLQPVLQEMSDILKGQAEFIKEMSSISSFMQQNMEVMNKLPTAIEEMGETSKKLGELFSKIYNRSFL
jgi:hypothetical protein